MILERTEQVYEHSRIRRFGGFFNRVFGVWLGAATLFGLVNVAQGAGGPSDKLHASASTSRDQAPDAQPPAEDSTAEDSATKKSPDSAEPVSESESTPGDSDRMKRRQAMRKRMREMMSRDDGAPKVGERAPFFTAARYDDTASKVSTASFIGRRPVLLFFGSYT